MTYRHNGGPRLDTYRPRLHNGPDGWVRIERRSRDHWLVGFGQPVSPMDGTRGALSRGEAWQDLIMECNYEAGTIKNGGQRMEILPGQLVGAVSWLANRWNWSPKTVRGFLDKLENEGMISFSSGKDLVIPKGKQANIVTLCNYPEYQLLTVQQGQTEGQSKGNQRANEGQTKGDIYRKQEEQEEQYIPPTPQGGNANKAKPKSSLKQPDAELADKAIDAWNHAAIEHGFVRVTVITDKRRRRLIARVAEIGGFGNFLLALSTIPKVPFLMGQVPPRPGEGPFKFEFEHLLQTDGKLGDVLAKLVDKAQSLGQQQGQKPWETWDDDEWVRQIAQHANGIWPSDKLSPPPGSKYTACPQAVIESERLIERYDENGFSRIKH